MRSLLSVGVLIASLWMMPAVAATRKWPFPPIQQPVTPAPVGAQDDQAQAPAAAKTDAKRQTCDAALGDVRNLSTVQALGVRRMVIDVVLVAVWGALIPALMWLGAASGF